MRISAATRRVARGKAFAGEPFSSPSSFSLLAAAVSSSLISVLWPINNSLASCRLLLLPLNETIRLLPALLAKRRLRQTECSAVMLLFA